MKSGTSVPARPTQSGLCAHSGFCTDRAPSAFRAHEEPFVAAVGDRFDQLSLDGPCQITGAIKALDDTGAAEPRNEGTSLEHYSLCRCGKSQNKPFCSRSPTPAQRSNSTRT